MTRRLLIGAAIIVLLPVALPRATADQLRNLRRGQPLPAFNMPGLDAQPVTSEDARGKALVIVYLSARQRQSERALVSAHKVVSNLGQSDLKLVYMSADTEEGDYFRQFRDRSMAHEPFAFDQGRRFYGQLGLIVFPTTIVASTDGKLLHVIASWNRDYQRHLELYCRHALGQFDDEELTTRLTAEPQTDDEARSKALRHVSVASIYRAKGLTDQAVRELEQAIAIDPTCSVAVVDLADLLVARGDIDDAERRINVLIVKQPDFHGAKLTLGLIQLERGDLDAAEAVLKEALTLNPDPIRANQYLGRLYERKGDYKLAMEHYREALQRALKEQ